MLSITKTFEFCASHRLWREEWDLQKNTEVFGKCANPNGHGHNYLLEVSVAGPLDPKTGMVLDAAELSRLVHGAVVDDVDHKHLDRDVAWLEGQVNTVEVLVEAMWQRLASALAQRGAGLRLHRIKLWETSRIFAEKTA